MEMAGDDHRARRRGTAGIDGGPPQDLPGEVRFAFIRIELPPHRRMDAVGADQDIGLVDSVVPDTAS